MYNILIIDDNHSFIDSLKVMLKDFPFQYDSVFQYESAEKMIIEKKTYINQNVVDKLLEYHESVKKKENDYKQENFNEPNNDENKNISSAKSNKSNEINDILKIDYPPFLFDGYFLIIIEQDTERNTKGTDFIQNMINKYPSLTKSDFILMSSKVEQTQPITERYGITFIEKPIKYPALKQFIKQKIKKTEDLKKLCDSLIDTYAVEIKSVELEKKKADRKLLKNNNKLKLEEEISSPPKKKNTASKSTSKVKKSNKKQPVKSVSKKKKS
ncbi:MAG: hypothetical protein OEZ22_05040 [Spirochaetia bacterium]|nr:hypothetical protein [Spirochaetia bacterium]